MCLELFASRHRSIGLVILAVKLLELLLTDREEHRVVHGLLVVLNVSSCKHVRPILHNIDKERDHCDASKFYDDDFVRIFLLIFQFLLGLLALVLEKDT